MKFVKIILALLLVAVLFKFNLDNKESVSVVLYQYTSPLIPAGLLLMTTFVLGMIAASFGSTLKIVQLKRQLGRLQPVSAQDSAPKKKKKEKKNMDKAAEHEPVVAPQQCSDSVEEVVVTPPPATEELVTDAVYEDDMNSATMPDVKEDDPQQDVIELPLDHPVPAQTDDKKE